MTRETTSEHTDEPSLPEGAVLTPKQVRYLWIAVIIMGILLIVGFFLVVGKIIHGANTPSRDRVKKPAPVHRLAVPSSSLVESINLPVASGSSIKSFTLNGGRLAVHLLSPSGEEIAIVDLSSGNVVSRVKIKEE